MTKKASIKTQRELSTQLFEQLERGREPSFELAHTQRIWAAVLLNPASLTDKRTPDWMRSLARDPELLARARAAMKIESRSKPEQIIASKIIQKALGENTPPQTILNFLDALKPNQHVFKPHVAESIRAILRNNPALKETVEKLERNRRFIEHRMKFADAGNRLRSKTGRKPTSGKRKYG